MVAWSEPARHLVVSGFALESQDLGSNALSNQTIILKSWYSQLPYLGYNTGISVKNKPTTKFACCVLWQSIHGMLYLGLILSLKHVRAMQNQSMILLVLN